MNTRQAHENDQPPDYAELQPLATRVNAELRPSPVASPSPPAVDQCLAHLKLLGSFNRLREDVGASDGLFGIRNDYVPSHPDNERRREILARVCEKRWEVYVTRACVRFQAYWKTLESNSSMLVEERLERNDYASIASRSPPIFFDIDNLPPLDVLMVYHAFLLNPRNFFADCIRYGKMGVWAAGMPWQVVASAIDDKTAEYKPSPQSLASFETKTRHPWNNLDEPSTLPLKCPKCSNPIRSPWTTVDRTDAWTGNTPGEGGKGFADKGFAKRCPCGLEMNHQLLRTQKFKTDMRALFVAHIPMPGTFLTVSGLPDVAVKTSPGRGTYPMTFPNRLLKAGLAKKIARVCSVRAASRASVQHILNQIKVGMTDEGLLQKASGSKSGLSRILMEERIAIRRTMSAYWDNSSIFNMDLVGAVIRQNSFTAKMCDIDWLHSPVAASTMARLISKYENYIAMIARYPSKVVVPCLDIDLAWHTHQTLPSSYYAYSIEKTGVFIDHDDKIGANQLAESFEWTCKTYQEMFNHIYSECICWYCEAVRESQAPEASTFRISRLFKADNNDPINKDLKELYKSAQAVDTKKSAHNHISAHNAIRTQYEDPNHYLASVVQNHKLDRNYELACERARKQGREPPNREEYSKALSWGYEVPVRGEYAPYMGDPTLSCGLYAVNPACASTASRCCPGPQEGIPTAGVGGGYGGGGSGGDGEGSGGAVVAASLLSG